MQVRDLDLRSGDRVKVGLNAERDVSVPVLFLPGLFAGGWIWQETIVALAERGQCFVAMADPLAKSAVDGMAIPTLAEHVVAVLDEIGIEKAVICGNSLGGLVAVDLAHRFPDRIPSLVVSGAPGLGGGAETSRGATRRIDRQFVRGIAERLFFDPRHITEEMIDQTYSVFSDRKALANVVRGLAAARDYDVRAILGTIACEVLLVWGENDSVTPVMEWSRNVARLPRGHLRVIPRCGHCPMIERPDEFNALLLEFLSKGNGAGADGWKTGSVDRRVVCGLAGESAGVAEVAGVAGSA